MFSREKCPIALCVLILILSILSISPIILAQDETNDAKVIERYKLMLSQKPKEGSTFDRLYQFYLEGTGLAAMVTDYQAEAQAKPNDPNIQLILGHIYKRLGKDKEALAAYQRAVALAQNDYYAHFALGQFYVVMRQHEDAISELTQAATLSEQTQTISPEELTDIYKTLGHAYFSRDKLEEAIKAWEKISELDPQNIFARIELADLFREQELYPQAIAQHQAIIDIKKDDAYRKCLSLREIGKIHEGIGAYDKARQHYDEALNLTAPGNWLRKDLQHRIIAIYSADANWKDLITYYQGKIETNPNNPEMLGLLASAYIENQQLDEGTNTYKKGLELAPTDTGLRLSLIDALRNSEMSEDAASEYEILSEQQPDDFGIYRELGKLYVQLENVDKAKEVYQKMIDRDPKNASTHLTLAEIYIGHEWIDDAVAAYQKAISLAPNNLDYIEYFGEFYFRQANREKAIETWNQMVSDAKSTAENYDRLARLLETKTFPTEAIEASRKAVEMMPEAYRFRVALAKRLMNNKQYDEALLEYTEAVKLAPNDFFAEQMDDQRIELYRRQGTLVEKIEALESELEESELTDTNKFTNLKRLAKMLLKSGNTTYALEILLKAKELQPDDVTINRWTAEVYVKQGRRDDAINLYTHLTDIDNSNAREYYSNIANAYLKVMDFEKATEAAKQVIAHSPRNPEGHHLLAQIARQSGDYESATDSFKQAIRLRPEAIDIRTELAAAHNLAGNTRQAIAQYWRCWELSDNINDKLSFLKPLSEAYYNLGRRDELEQKLKQIVKSNTSAVAPVLALAQIYRNEGDLPSARFQLARALDRQNENPELLFQLVEISLDLGDTQEALNYQQQLVKTTPDPIHQQKLGELLFDSGREQEAIQVWSKVLHAKNQTFDAEMKLAELLIQHGLLEEVLFALDSAAQKISGADAHIHLYQIGTKLVEINESDRALPHFTRIIEMPKPSTDASVSATSKKAAIAVPTPTYNPPGANRNKLTLATSLYQRIQNSPYGSRGRQAWVPTNFEEAQAGALVQMRIIMDDKGELNEFVQQFEDDAAENPKDTQTLELLAQLHLLNGNHEKSQEITEKLIAVAPNNPEYQRIQLDMANADTDLDHDKFKTLLDKMTWLTPESREWYIAEYARRFHYQGKKEDAEKLLVELENSKVINSPNSQMLVEIFVQLGKFDAAKKIFDGVKISSSGQQSSRMYDLFATNLLSKGKIEEAVAIYKKYFDRTKPRSTNPRRTTSLGYSNYSYGGYTPIQSAFPSPTTYYNQSRLQYLQSTFSHLWATNQHQALYDVFQTELDAAEGRDKIYPALAISYCYWWENKRDQAQKIFADLQKEFPEDLTLKINTVLVSIQIGEFKAALTLLNNLAEADPRNRRQYYDLTLQIAVHIGDSVTVRDLMTKILNSPTGVRELYQFSTKLQQAGLTQYAIAVAKKTMTLALRERDPNFLVQLSQHLNQLGRGQDASRIAARALRFANQRDRYGRTLHSYSFQQAANLAKPSTVGSNPAVKLEDAAKKNPNSFQAQLKLVSYYESRNQIKKASDAYEAALKLRPKDHNTRIRYAQMLQRNRQSKNAVAQYSILLKDSKNINTMYSNYWEILGTFFEAREVDKLVSIAKELIDNNKDQYSRGFEFARRAAELCVSRKNAKAAVEIYEKLMESDRYNVYLQLADAYAASGARDKAIKLLKEKLQTTNPDSQVSIILKLSKYNEALDNIKAFLAKYEEKINDETTNPSTLYLVAVTKIVTADIEGADPIVNRLIEHIPLQSRLQWLNTLADIYKEKADTDREIRMLEAAIEKFDARNSYQLSGTYQKLGTAYTKKGDKEKAKEFIRKMGILRLMRQGGAAYYEKERIARIYSQYEMWDEAEILFTEVINDLSGQQHYRERAQRELMTIRQRRGGTSSLKSTPETERINISLQRSMAQQHMRQNQIPQAIELYEQIEKAMPEDLESRSQLASLYSREKQHDKALKIWVALLEVDPENTKYQDGIIRAYQSAGRINNAIELAQKYIQEDAETSVHYVRLAQLYGSSNQIEDAIKTYKKAIELSSEDWQVYENLAGLYLRNDRLDESEKAFKEALKYAPQTGQQRNIHRQMMDIYRRKGTLEEFLKEVEKKGTLTYSMQRELARNFKNQGNLDKAAKAYEKALQLTTQEWEQQDVERQLISIYRSQGKLEEKLKEAEKNDTLTFNMQVELARQYRAKGESDKAISAYKKAINKTKRSHEMDNVYRELMLEYVRRGEDDSVIELYETMSQSTSSGTSINYSPTGFDVRLSKDKPRETLINAYKTQDKLDTLQTLFEGKLAKEANDLTTLEVIAEIYRNSNNHEKAAEAYHALSKADPTNIHAFYYAAAAFSKTGKSEQAKELLNHGAAALSSSHQSQDFWFLCSLGTVCYNSELYTSAIKIFKDAIIARGSQGYGGNSTTDEEKLYDLIGKSALAAKQYEEAVEAFQELGKITRNSTKKANAERSIKQAYKDGNLYEKHLPAQIKKVEENPDNVDARFSLAQSYETNDKFAEAIAQYEKISELQPKNAQWHKKVGNLYEKSTHTNKQERYEKASAAYEKAISFNSTSYELYTALANIYTKQDSQSKAEAVYRQALQASLSPTEHDSAVKAILKLYDAKEHTDKRLAILTELGAKSGNSPLLQKLLGDTYVESGDTDKAAQAYKKWFEILKSEPNQRNYAQQYFVLAEELLNKNIMLDFTLELAKQAAETRPDPVYFSTLGHAYLANENYDKALVQFQRSLIHMNHNSRHGGNGVEHLLTRISQVGKNVKNKESYLEMIEKLVEVLPQNIGTQTNVNLSLAKFCHDIGMTDAAKIYIQKTGFLPETAWLTLGPFDNTKGVGYNTAYIPEEVARIDTNAKYDGVTGPLTWKQASDEVFDGFFEFGKDEGWYTAYAWISFTSPEERKVQIRFDSDDQGKVWLNGKKVYAHRRTRGAQIDRRTIPVTLVAGKNTILVKVCNESLPWGFFLRITDTEGNPFEDLKLGSIEEN